MWPRDFELAIALWLGISPFIFSVPADHTAVWAVDLAAGAVVVTIACLCYWKPLQRAHLLTAAIGVGLALWGWVQPRPVIPEHQNHMIVGLLLLMFGIIPSESSRPPKAWRET